MIFYRSKQNVFTKFASAVSLCLFVFNFVVLVNPVHAGVLPHMEEEPRNMPESNIDENTDKQVLESLERMNFLLSNDFEQKRNDTVSLKEENAPDDPSD